MRRALPWVALALLGACGGTTKSTPDANDAGTASGASADGGGAEAAGGSSGRAGAGSSMGGKAPNPSAGAGGKVPDFPGGASFGALACDAPYAGPAGGPRVDGPPELLGSCQDVSDDVVLARYDDYKARVPQGLYFEADESIAFWSEPCSMSEEETVKRGPSDGMGTFVTSFSNEWFYEAVYCFDNSLRRVERSLRCDYFDGSKLAQPTPTRLAFLASLLWWGRLYNVGGNALLGHAVTIGDATDVVEMCGISVTYGDFGLCDEVRLESTKHRLMFDGTVMLGTPSVVRTLKGDCH